MKNKITLTTLCLLLEMSIGQLDATKYPAIECLINIALSDQTQDKTQAFKESYEKYFYKNLNQIHQEIFEFTAQKGLWFYPGGSDNMPKLTPDQQKEVLSHLAKKRRSLLPYFSATNNQNPKENIGTPADYAKNPLDYFEWNANNYAKQLKIEKENAETRADNIQYLKERLEANQYTSLKEKQSDETLLQSEQNSLLKTKELIKNYERKVIFYQWIMPHWYDTFFDPYIVTPTALAAITFALLYYYTSQESNETTTETTK